MVKLNKDALHPLYNVDIGTGNALETLELQNLYDKYESIYINVECVARNYMDCLDLKADDKLRIFKANAVYPIKKGIADVLEEIVNVVKDRIEIYFYYPNYRTVYKKVNNVRKIDDYEGWRYWFFKRLDGIVTSAMTMAVINVNKYDYKISALDNSIIFTHIPFDLLSFNKNANVVLLESFTGKIKEKNEWSTKYHKIGKKDLSFLPFMEMLYYILGDKHLIKPMGIKIRNKVYEIALNNHWTSSTGYNTVYNKLRNDKELKKIIDNLPRLFNTK